MSLQGFERRGGRLYCEDTALEEIAERYGTPAYVYSAGAILDNYRAYDQALAEIPHEIHFAVKANGSLGVLALLAQAGAGFDIVSGGELYRVLAAGGDPEKVVFSGVGKSLADIEYAIRSGIGSFNCESEGELELLRSAAVKLGAAPRIALRVNPDINAVTHPYIATGLSAHKFGVGIKQAEELYGRAAEFAPLEMVGVSCHIGSQIFDVKAFLDALERLLDLLGRLRATGAAIEHLDLGGGLGVGYKPEETPPAIADYAAQLASALEGRGLRLMLEPGRSIVGRAGVLLARTLYRKRNGDKTFLIVDAAMNDLIRPALYQSHHEIVPVVERGGEQIVADVVGPICETGDFLARDCRITALDPGELIAICTAGAYGFVQASNYNARPRAAEVLVEGAQARLIRRRETFEDLVRGEVV